ncbi:hypothetical protein SAMN04487910_0206 [Aquimarina amphilecti]|uniref:Uncharacterized protein n=1 Tax=Aquimarina amphilecti TaxID=1038014 RepID=A0A1H7FX17_AQUAM|nr:hypothetical protein [Aquimarina amphilecti]SEK30478.1 hypothetical protein SAMN04487910_0206 [Aquimarina amphilecti]
MSKRIVMNKMRLYNLLFLIVVLIPSSVLSQEKNDLKPILENVMDFYENTARYTVEIEQTLLRGKSGTNISENYNGNFIKDKGYSKLILLNSEVIQFPGVRLIIDHDNKAIEYSKTPIGPSTPIDLKGFLKYYEGSSLKSNDKQWICELTVIPSAAFVPSDKILLYVNKDLNYVEKQVLFLSRKLPFKLKDGTTEEDFGRLEIVFKHDLNLSDKVNDKLSNYISKTGSNMAPVKKYNGYQIVNLSN